MLGSIFTSQNDFLQHVEKRIESCRQSFYILANVGLSYSGLSTDAKVYLWNTLCVPSLIFSCEALALKSIKEIGRLESCKGTLVKQFMGIGKRYHHSKL